ncbi:MAG: hypothetical protein CL569_18080 [Alphaproteobacteria bacterium]|nr:hypothetical protein [Alphaproteobacteria bacterium]|tara:strand:+ start:914 stop:1339 length:426 start_codon:yes stop_codon:yes gene_type:complete
MTLNEGFPEELPPLSWTLTQEQINAYAEVAGASDPIHIDPEFAKETPLGGTIGQGFLLFAVMTEQITRGLDHPESWLSDGVLDVRFRAPARPGDRLTMRAVRTVLNQDSSGDAATYEVWCEGPDGQRLIDGTTNIPVGAFD